MAKDNQLLGKFDLSSIWPASHVVPQIEVSFETDANGILQVTAEDKETAKKNDITITNDHSSLSGEEIKRMMAEAEKFAEDDQKLKEHVEAQNELEAVIYSVWNEIKDTERGGCTLSEEAKQTVQNVIEEEIAWIEKNKASASIADLIQHKKNFEAAIQPVMSVIHQQRPEQNSRSELKLFLLCDLFC